MHHSPIYRTRQDCEQTCGPAVFSSLHACCLCLQPFLSTSRPPRRIRSSRQQSISSVTSEHCIIVSAHIPPRQGCGRAVAAWHQTGTVLRKTGFLNVSQNPAKQHSRAGPTNNPAISQVQLCRPTFDSHGQAGYLMKIPQCTILSDVQRISEDASLPLGAHRPSSQATGGHASRSKLLFGLPIRQLLIPQHSFLFSVSGTTS